MKKELTVRCVYAKEGKSLSALLAESFRAFIVQRLASDGKPHV